MKGMYKETFGILYKPDQPTQSVQNIVDAVMAELYPDSKARTIYAIVSTVAAALIILPQGKVAKAVAAKIGSKAATTSVGSFLLKAQGAGLLSKLSINVTKSDVAWFSLGLASDLSVLESYNKIEDGKFQIQKWMNPQSLIDFLEVCTIDERLLPGTRALVDKLFVPQDGLPGHPGELDLWDHIIPAAWYADCIHLAAERAASKHKGEAERSLVALRASVIRSRIYKLLVQMYEQDVQTISFNTTENHLSESVKVGGLSDYGVQALQALIVYAAEAKKVLGEVGHETVSSLIAVAAHRAVSKNGSTLKKMTTYLYSRGVDVFLLGEGDE